jgi:hypothetical protein
MRTVIDVEQLTPEVIREMEFLGAEYLNAVGRSIMTERARFNAGMYLAVAATGKLVLVTARNEGRPVGFILGYVMDNPHFDCQVGVVGLYFVEKMERGSSTGLRLLKRLEAEFQALGAQYIETHARWESPVNGMFERIGYTRKDILYMKSLKGEQNV